MPNEQITELIYKFNNHQHRGFDGSQQLALLDWKILARNTLAVASTSLILDNIPPRTFMRAFISHGAKTGTSNNFLRFNNDSGANYTFIEEINNIARTSQTEIDLCDGANASQSYFYIVDIVNVPGIEKCIDSVAIRRITAASTGQTRHRVSGTWVNTTNAITRMDLISSDADTFPAASQIVVFGCNFS